MHALTILGAVAALCGSAAASPAIADSPLDARDAGLEKRADPTAPWVTVDDEGRPVTTMTPAMSTISGTPTLANAAPYDLTASVYTWTTWGQITTSTGEPPNPTATSSSNQGSFSRCYNLDGDYAPFCTPYENSTLLTGSIYYITWDPDYYNKTTSSNMTYQITVRLDYLNTTSNQYVKLESFDNSRVPASWGFFPLNVGSNLLMGEKINNATITLLSAPNGTVDKTNSVALPILIQAPPLPKNTPTPAPEGRTLTIALPICFGTIALLVVGVCLWNRKTRRIELGNIMSRSRHGYNGLKARRRRLFRSKRDNGIQLDNADAALPAGEYHDAPTLPRRDSEALGSLAGSPIHATFEEQGATAGGRNAFRDELSRQDVERRDMH